MKSEKTKQNHNADELDLEQLEAFSGGRLGGFDVMLTADDGGTATTGTRSICHVDGNNEPATN